MKVKCTPEEFLKLIGKECLDRRCDKTETISNVILEHLDKPNDLSEFVKSFYESTLQNFHEKT